MASRGRHRTRTMIKTKSDLFLTAYLLKLHETKVPKRTTCKDPRFLVPDVTSEDQSKKSSVRPCSGCACCTIYSTSLFDLDMTDRHLKLKMPNTLSQGNAQLKTQVLLVDIKFPPQKKLISIILWIRKKKHKRLT